MFHLSQGETVAKAVPQPATNTVCRVSLCSIFEEDCTDIFPCRWAAMDPETIQAAKKIVNRRGKGDVEGVEARLASLEGKLDGLHAVLEDLTKLLSKSKLLK